jgi:hypothetical protein
MAIGHFMSKPANIRPQACSVKYFKYKFESEHFKPIFARSTVPGDCGAYTPCTVDKNEATTARLSFCHRYILWRQPQITLYIVASINTLCKYFVLNLAIKTLIFVFFYEGLEFLRARR